MTFEAKVERFSDLEALGRRAAEIFEGQFRFALAERARLSVALSRPTPREVFERISEVRLPPRAHLFQVDERCAEKDSDDRNAKLIKGTLARWVEEATFHPMPVDGRSLRGGAGAYEEALFADVGRPPRLDLVHLGLGADGHTASLLPGDPVLEVTDSWVASTKRRAFPKERRLKRMTLTYPALDAARLVVFIVTGKEKAAALKRVLAGDREMPAARIGAKNVIFLIDRAAARA